MKSTIGGRRTFLAQGAVAALSFSWSGRLLRAAKAPPPLGPSAWPRAIVERCRIQCIWGDRQHNGFPGIARVGDYYYVTFRHASGHISPEGTAKIFVIRSKVTDLKQWAQVAEFTHEHDARDPLVFDNGGKVQVVYHSKEDYYSQSSDGITWTAPSLLDTEIVQPAGDNPLVLSSTRRWLFRIRRGPDGAFYSLARCGINVKGTRGRFGLILYRSEDGVKFKAMHTYGEGPTAGMGPGRSGGHEADIAWAPDGTAVFAIRNNADGVIVTGRTPNGPWRAFGTGSMNFGGPALHRTKQGGLLVAGRHMPQRGYALCRVQTVTSEGLENPYIVPSGGDCAYQSFVDGPEDSVLLAYYSSHEEAPRNGANIYLAHLSIRHEPPVGPTAPSAKKA